MAPDRATDTFPRAHRGRARRWSMSGRRSRRRVRTRSCPGFAGVGGEVGAGHGRELVWWEDHLNRHRRARNRFPTVRLRREGAAGPRVSYSGHTGRTCPRRASYRPMTRQSFHKTYVKR
jgi:hypothetical protein